MRIYHQCGHNTVWNVSSLEDDSAGHGLIVSPVNIPSDKLADRISQELRNTSFLDPQFYRPQDNKNYLETYTFFPANVLDGFNTTNFQSVADTVATECLKFQHLLDFEYSIIPTRYYEHLPQEYLTELSNLFVDPFLQARERLGISKPTLLTVIVRDPQLEDGLLRNELLSWITGFSEIAGVYVIFENSETSKQIKNPDHLVQVLSLIHI